MAHGGRGGRAAVARGPRRASAPEGAPRTLAELGLAIERDGSFRFDSDTLTAALERDASGVAAMFTTGINGIYATIDRMARSNAMASDPGSLAGSVARYQSQSEQVALQLEELAEKQENLRATMVARFAQTYSSAEPRRPPGNPPGLFARAWWGPRLCA